MGGHPEYCQNLEHYIESKGNCKGFGVNNLHTHTLSHPPNVEVALSKIHSMFFVGILELYDASVCVLSYQLGQFNKSKCDCALKKSPTSKPLNVHEKKATLVVDHLKNELVQRSVAMDSILYYEASLIVMTRIIHVERQMGVKMICNDIEDPLRSYVSSRFEVVERFVD
jgi:hypothetical protein